MYKLQIDNLLMLFSSLDRWSIYGASIKQGPLDQRSYNMARIHINAIREFVRDIPLPGCILSVNRIEKYVEDKRENDDVLKAMYDDLVERIVYEVENCLVLLIPIDRAEYYKPDKPIFGKDVADKFPDIGYDIEEACNCFALNRDTACVFHLMRIMEHAVQKFGEKLNVQSVQEKNWHNIIEEITRENKKMDQKSDITKSYAIMASHLYNVKVAWRNPTMHPKATYTKDEARSLLNAVEIFMKDLAKIL